MHHNRHNSVNQILQETTNHASDELPVGYRYVLTQNALVPTQPFLFTCPSGAHEQASLTTYLSFQRILFFFSNSQKPKYTMPSFSDHTLGSGFCVKSWMQIWPCRNMYEALFSSEFFFGFGIVAFLFLFVKYCSIMK